MEQTLTLTERTEVSIVAVPGQAWPGPPEQIAVSVRTEEVTIQADAFYVGSSVDDDAPDFLLAYQIAKL